MSPTPHENTAGHIENRFFDRDAPQPEAPRARTPLARAKSAVIAAIEACLSAMNRVPLYIEH